MSHCGPEGIQERVLGVVVLTVGTCTLSIGAWNLDGCLFLFGIGPSACVSNLCMSQIDMKLVMQAVNLRGPSGVRINPPKATILPFNDIGTHSPCNFPEPLGSDHEMPDNEHSLLLSESAGRLHVCCIPCSSPLLMPHAAMANYFLRSIPS